MTSSPPAGRVVQVNVSPGGVPKLPVSEARVGRNGLVGDAHDHNAVHGSDALETAKQEITYFFPVLTLAAGKR